MKDVPLFGWVCLGIIILMVLGLYLSLLNAWRRKGHPNSSSPSQGDNIINTLRQPWAREDANWEKLHSQTEELMKNQPPPPGGS